MSEIPKLRVREIRFSVLQTKTRFPFRYGIAAMTEAPHLFVRCELEVNGQEAIGIASEGLPPKWFTKNAETTFEEDDLPGMKRAIFKAAEFSEEIHDELTFFEFWQAIKHQQDAWAEEHAVAPLLSQLGTALMERTVLDGLCRSLGKPLHRLVGENLLGLRLGELHSSLKNVSLNEFYRRKPLESIRVRHTVGLADPLTDSDIPDSDRIDDGLPHSLVSNIREYGLSHFKLKLCGELDADRDRLRELATLFDREAPNNYRVTIDGNEQYRTLESFRDHFLSHQSDSIIAPLFEHLLFVEQPIHRDHALEESVRMGFQSWQDAPSVIIDESDECIGSLPRALELGYVGTSHKNCKGIIKSLANGVLIDRVGGVMSAEDLANLGPVALLQDLAMVSLLGIDHVERNGHHYFAGLSMFPQLLQDSVVEAHPDLYRKGEQCFASLIIEKGELDLNSVNQAPFGIGVGAGSLEDLGKGLSASC